MTYCDINCDMGEGIENDALIMPFVSSANIACGYHAGDQETILNTILLAKEYRVHIGAHPSFLDRENFGRTEMNIPVEEIYLLVKTQIRIIDHAASATACKLHHVKPHGALYNMAARDRNISKAIVLAIKDYDDKLILYGLSNSYLISEGALIGLQTVSEVFADRTYQEDGSLTPRTHANALVTNREQAIIQSMQMVKEGKVKTVTGKEIPIKAESICIHGDGAHAVEFAKSIHATFQKNNIFIGSLK